ncbi:J domain-containing protein [Halosimplex sp. TS25]|uniref:J domain-containing protein n=1 Tax=Halosimplex rarum TaxID=3396619 RepID=UPI0039E74F44
MYGPRLVSALAAVFAATAVLFAIFGLTANVGFFAVAALFGAVAYFMWYHASGRFAQRLYRSVEQRAEPGSQRGGFGAGPREDWEPPRDEGSRRRARAAAGGQRARREQRGGRRRRGRGPGQQRRQRAAAAAQRGGPTAAEAYDTLDLEPGADDDAVKAAYREKVKEVHPDAASGDEERFKEVNAAYERLTDD